MLSRPAVDPRSLWSFDALSGRDVQCLLDTGLRLRDAHRAGTPSAPLRGRNLALLNQQGSAEESDHLREAALGLGAKVADLPTQVGGPGDAATVRLLGRLYDAIDCDSLAPAVVESIARESGVPVFNGLGRAGHPSRAIAELLPLQERCGKPLAQLNLCYLGDPGTPCSVALLRLAAHCGIGLRIVPTATAGVPAALPPGRFRLCGSRAEAEAEADLVIDASDGRSWSLPGVDAAERRANHRYALQAMLLATMN